MRPNQNYTKNGFVSRDNEINERLFMQEFLNTPRLSHLLPVTNLNTFKPQDHECIQPIFCIALAGRPDDATISELTKIGLRCIQPKASMPITHRGIKVHENYLITPNIELLTDAESIKIHNDTFHNKLRSIFKPTPLPATLTNKEWASEAQYISLWFDTIVIKINHLPVCVDALCFDVALPDTAIPLATEAGLIYKEVATDRHGNLGHYILHLDPRIDNPVASPMNYTANLKKHIDLFMNKLKA